MKKVLVSAVALALSAGAASATTIFYDSFEEPDIGTDWRVYADPFNFGDWDPSSGTGIEVQQNGAVSGVATPFGNQYVELDSDCERTGIAGSCPDSNTNSSMTRTQNLNPGTYELSFWYLPRTNVLGDNTISAYIAGDSEGLFDNLLGTVDGAQPADWTEYAFTFTVDGFDDPYAISFRAGGTENELGGFIDAVKLSIVPLPAAGWMLLAGLGGMAALRRRQKS